MTNSQFSEFVQPHGFNVEFDFAGAIKAAATIDLELARVAVLAVQREHDVGVGAGVTTIAGQDAHRVLAERRCNLFVVGRRCLLAHHLTIIFIRRKPVLQR